jgi:hypothetical protein
MHVINIVRCEIGVRSSITACCGNQLAKNRINMNMIGK